MKVSEKSDVHPLFFSQLLSYFLSAMRQGFYSIFTSSSPLKSLKVAKFQKMSLFKMSKKWTPKSFEIFIDQISYLFQHLCFNHIWVDPNLDHRLPMQQEWNWCQIWNSFIDQKPKPSAKWPIFCLFERLLEFLMAYIVQQCHKATTDGDLWRINIQQFNIMPDSRKTWPSKYCTVLWWSGFLWIRR